ncbi:MAG TPA: translation elongation factor Ts [Candidatus Brocadiia bacterium]|nr:translation elongation factor Ts [Candidatus Brocadiia bacterium]
MEVDSKLVKDLREKTGVGMMKCKKALEEAGGDMEKAIIVLRKMGEDTAAKKSSRGTNEGWIGSYVHSNGKLAVLVEVQCETDFVARNESFQELVKDLCFQVAASNPVAVCREEIPPAIIEREKEVYAAQIKGKPPQIVEKILEGKLKKFYEDSCLLEQKFVKDTNRTIQEIINDRVSALGENIKVSRFVRIQMGS